MGDTVETLEASKKWVTQEEEEEKKDLWYNPVDSLRFSLIQFLTENLLNDWFGHKIGSNVQMGLISDNQHVPSSRHIFPSF